MNVCFYLQPLFCLHFLHVIDQRIALSREHEVFLRQSQTGTKIVLTVPDESDVSETHIVFGTLFDIILKNLALAQIDGAKRTCILNMIHFNLKAAVVVKLGWISKHSVKLVFKFVNFKNMLNEHGICIRNDNGLCFGSVYLTKQIYYAGGEFDFTHAVQDLLRLHIGLMQVAKDLSHEVSPSLIAVELFDFVGYLSIWCQLVYINITVFINDGMIKIKSKQNFLLGIFCFSSL